MSRVPSFELQGGNRLQRELVAFAKRSHEKDLNSSKFREAIEAVDNALTETISYMQSRKNGQEPSPRKEVDITDLWMDASRAIIPFDGDLADACMMKGLGWTDPKIWEKAEIEGKKISIDDMIEARSSIARKYKDILPSVPKYQMGHIGAGRPIHIAALVLSFLFAAGCIYGGIQLISAPGSGETAFRFVGLEFTTKQAGVAGIGLGAVVVILTFRRVLKSLDYLGQL